MAIIDLPYNNPNDDKGTVNGSYQGTISEYTYDSIMDVILKMPIEEMCDFNKFNRNVMLRLLNINALQKNAIQNNLGYGIAPNGSGDAITAPEYEYSKENNYATFAKNVQLEEIQGVNTTRYSQPEQGKVENLYPDELGKLHQHNSEGGYYHTWTLNSERDSLLNKHKRLFEQKKINTIISRFSTAAETAQGVPLPSGTVGSRYGMSHGRNLLTRAAENGEPANYNGYKNPYCRVWTHHYQYNQVKKMMRPFLKNDGKIMKLEDWHKQMPFRAKYVDDNNKNVGSVGFDQSVLQDNGFVNITPKFRANGETNPISNIHTKQCMFSIENLAWKDYSPYEFENNLSWEQRGPLGGRIMWFPPYGISFNETTQVKWNSNTFIGRGEDVYTYTNTTRTGTLSFMMVVDHPSIINYFKGRANAGETDKNTSGGVNDNDILRFFAGCDPFANGDDITGGGDNRIYKYHLFDEYLKGVEQGYDPFPTRQHVNQNPDSIKPELSGETLKIGFAVFYPNNYSGYTDYYDPKNFDDTTRYEWVGSQNTVDMISYLLTGRFAGEVPDLAVVMENPDITTDVTNNDAGTNKDYHGYELGTGLSCYKDKTINKAINLSSKSWERYTNGEKYNPSNNRRIYYRIDGSYEVDRYNNKNSMKIWNCYDQILATKNYEATNNGQRNLSAKEAIEAITDLKIVNYELTDTWEDNLDSKKVYMFSLHEVVLAARESYYKYCEKNQYPNTITEEIKKRVNVLKDVFGIENKYSEFTKITSYGVSTSHGNNSTYNKKRNEFLAEARAHSAINWLQYASDSDTVKLFKPNYEKITYDATHANSKVSGSDINSKEAVSRRCALVIIEVKYFAGEKIKDYKEKLANYEEELKQKKKDSQKKLDDSYESKLRTYFNKMYENDKKGLENLANIIIPTEDSVLTEWFKRDKDKLTNRYDKEYFFFRPMQENDPLVFDSLMKKIQYFDPAFHSMTPEGFTDRLAFLQQCTRQGNTVGASDKTVKSANNLAFGRPPFCVLRLGDFYYTKIIINSLNVQYDPLQWDLNAEGVGVIPMLAHITMSITFIGGSDIGGPIDRLQNAMSFNYYANQRFYDNRADRVIWDHNPEYTQFGGIQDYQAHNSLNSGSETESHIKTYTPHALREHKKGFTRPSLDIDKEVENYTKYGIDFNSFKEAGIWKFTLNKSIAIGSTNNNFTFNQIHITSQCDMPHISKVVLLNENDDTIMDFNKDNNEIIVEKHGNNLCMITCYHDNDDINKECFPGDDIKSNDKRQYALRISFQYYYYYHLDARQFFTSFIGCDFMNYKLYLQQKIIDPNDTNKISIKKCILYYEKDSEDRLDYIFQYKNTEPK